MSGRRSSISGFPELLPQERVVELRAIDRIRAVFESFGFCSIETRSVEHVIDLLSNGEDVDKEIYALKSLSSSADDAEKLALHFDLTVPMARYVAENYNELAFPFKRYQIQKVWRGERPQAGRFREFTQADIDVIDNERVSLQFDYELPLIALSALSAMNAPAVVLKVNNRKVLEGFYAALGITESAPVLRTLDKIEKIGPAKIFQILTEDLKLSSTQAQKCIDFASVKGNPAKVASELAGFSVSNALLDEGLSELTYVLNGLYENQYSDSVVFADLSISRGLDYYTGSVYEMKFANYPEFPTICAGGRYENLVGRFLNRRVPGVGISIGLTRVFAKMLAEKLIETPKACPTDVMLIRFSDSDDSVLRGCAATLRERGLNVEVYHDAKKIDHQIRYAVKKGIRYLWFAGAEDEVKDLTTGLQTKVVREQWVPAK